LTVQTINSASPTSQNTSSLSITGYELNKVGNELTVVQGRLPATASNQIEIALTDTEAKSLKVGVGSVITARFPGFVGQVTWTLHVVGIFAPNQNWEYNNTFQSLNTPSVPNGAPIVNGGSSNNTFYPVLASSSTLLPQISSLQITLPDRQLFGKGIEAMGVKG